MKRWRTGMFLLAIAASAACGHEDGRGSRLMPERFVEVNVALRQVDREHPQADSIREAVLAEHGVKEDDLRAFVLARADRPAELASIWDSIYRRLAADDVVPDLDPADEQAGDDERPGEQDHEAGDDELLPDTAPPPADPQPAPRRRSGPLPVRVS